MIRICIAAAMVLLLTRCDKLTLEDPIFSVNTDKISYRTGDTVRFVFEGHADYITFYSGETGEQYEYRDRTTADGNVTLEVTARLRNAISTQPNTLSLLTTAELAGRDSVSIVNAPWVDISDRLELPTANTDGSVPVGVADITDLQQPNKPVYLAWRFKSNNETSRVQPRWTIRDFNIVNTLDDGTSLQIGTRSTLDWVSLSIKNPAYAWIVVGGLYTNAPAINSGDTENWAVSRPLYLNAITRDFGFPVKDMTRNMLTTHEHVYTTPGTYKVVFVGRNHNVNESREMVRMLEVVVE